MLSSRSLNFNPRSREGSDQDADGYYAYFQISIHAPARGATLCIFLEIPASFRFQSTLPRGERLAKEIGRIGQRHFNPRSREGSDITRLMVVISSFRFQSTLPRGERPGSDEPVIIEIRFQSTLPRGERLCPVILIIASNAISIHAPARGATA